MAEEQTSQPSDSQIQTSPVPATDTQAVDGAAAPAPAADGAASGAEQQIQSSTDAASEGATQTFDALAPATGTEGTEAGTISLDSLQSLSELSVNAVYLMGTSFIVGVLFTVFILLVLDFLRSRSSGKDGKASS